MTIVVAQHQRATRRVELRPDARTRARAHASAVAAGVAGIGAAFLVARHGTPLWQVVRLLVVAGLTLCVVLALTRSAGARRAAVAASAGLVATTAGAGIGVPHLAKTGLQPATAAGLAMLAGGSLLLVGGTVMLVRVTPRWWRLAVVPATLVIVFVAASAITPAVIATNVPPIALGDETPADRGLDFQDVVFDTGDGVTLSGWYIPSTSGAAVVLLHGAGSTRSGVLDHAAVLAGHGLGVLLYDARGHGRSAGTAMDFGWFGDADVAAAVSFLEQQPDVDDGGIAAVGMSMGGEQAIGAAATDPRIRAVVAEGATNRTSGDWAWLPDEYGWRGALQLGIEQLRFGIADLLASAEPPITLRDAVGAAAPQPVLLIAGGSVGDEEHAARYIAGGSPDTVEVWIAPDTGHTDALDVDPVEWERRVISFLAAELGSLR